MNKPEFHPFSGLRRLVQTKLFQKLAFLFIWILNFEKKLDSAGCYLHFSLVHTNDGGVCSELVFYELKGQRHSEIKKGFALP